MICKYPYQFEVTHDDDTLILKHITPEDWENVVMPEGIRTLIITGYMDDLVIPDGVVKVYANALGLRRIHVSNSVKTLSVNTNCLRVIELPSDIEEVDLSHNPLGVLTFRAPPTALYSLDLENTMMQTLDFPAPSTLNELNLSRTTHLVYISPQVLAGLIRDHTDDIKHIWVGRE